MELLSKTTNFSIASRDELWLRGALVESRLMHGVATQRGDSIDASDARDDELVRACDLAIDAIGAIGAYDSSRTSSESQAHPPRR